MHHIIYGVGKGLVMAPLPQLLVRSPWGATSNSRTFFPSSARRPPIDGGAFAYAALLVCYTDYLWFCHFEVSSFSIHLAACGVTGGYVRGMKKALVIAPAPPLKVFSIMKCVCLLPKSLNSCGFAGLSL